MSDKERDKIVAKLRLFLTHHEPVDWQRLKAGLPNQREWLEANEHIDATLKEIIAGNIEASETTLNTLKAKYDATLEKELLKGVDCNRSVTGGKY